MINLEYGFRHSLLSNITDHAGDHESLLTYLNVRLLPVGE